MSRIGALIAELVPKGVPFKPLGEIGEFVRGNGLSKSDLTIEGFPAIHYGQIHTFYGTWTRTAKSFIEPAKAAKLRRANPGDLIIATTSEDDAAVAKATAWLGEGDVAVSGDAYIYRHSQDPRYIAYFFQSEHFQAQKARHITGTKVRRVSGDALSKIRVPVPPLEIQAEIVRIMDNFTELETELETELKSELNARQSQYRFYRDAAFKFESSIPSRPLGELALNHDNRRRPVTRDVREPGPIPYFGASGVVDYVQDYIFDGDYLLVSEDGANLLARSSPIAFSISGKTWVNNHAHVLEFSTYVDRRFVEIYLNSIDLAPYVSGAAQPKLNKANLNQIAIPDPPFDVKKRTVVTLDKFDAASSELCFALRAELSARRKQHDYYRDHLLTFSEVMS